MNIQTRRNIGATIVEVKEVDAQEDGLAWEEGGYLLMKIEIELRKPIARGRMINLRDRNSQYLLDMRNY